MRLLTFSILCIILKIRDIMGKECSLDSSKLWCQTCYDEASCGNDDVFNPEPDRCLVDGCADVKEKRAYDNVLNRSAKAVAFKLDAVDNIKFKFAHMAVLEVFNNLKYKLNVGAYYGSFDDVTIKNAIKAMMNKGLIEIYNQGSDISDLKDKSLDVQKTALLKTDGLINSSSLCNYTKPMAYSPYNPSESTDEKTLKALEEIGYSIISGPWPEYRCVSTGSDIKYLSFGASMNEAYYSNTTKSNLLFKGTSNDDIKARIGKQYEYCFFGIVMLNLAEFAEDTNGGVNQTMITNLEKLIGDLRANNSYEFKFLSEIANVDTEFIKCPDETVNETTIIASNTTSDTGADDDDDDDEPLTKKIWFWCCVAGGIIFFSIILYCCIAVSLYIYLLYYII